MEPIQILEAIKEDVRDKFDGDPLMMRTMNLVITEYKARSERLHKPVVGGPESECGSEGEQLATEAVATGVWDGERCPRCKSSDLLDTDDHWTHCQNCGFSFVGG